MKIDNVFMSCHGINFAPHVLVQFILERKPL